jgi:pimeloyl-ACP methyl ester carboxylesterase
MNHLIISTERDRLYLVGRIHTDPTRPALVAMSGIWAPADQLHELVDWFPEASVLVAPLPGMGGSKTREFHVPTFTHSLEATLEALLPNRRVVLVGGSTGCLVTLGVRSSQVVRQVAVEPFFRTAPLWPFNETARRMLSQEPDRKGAQIAAWELFGLKGDDVVDRDYRALLDGLTVPLDVLVGEAPLEPARMREAWPSLTSAEDRAMLAARPGVTIHVGGPDSGHQVAYEGEGRVQFRRILADALAAAASRRSDG